MRITKRQLRRIIREVEGSTKKYDDDSALKGGQSKLPDSLQRGIIDKTVEDREEHEEEEKEKNESIRITKRQLRRIIKEERIKLLREATASIEVDWAGDLRELQELPPDLSGKVISQSGGGGGWPLVLVQGDRQALKDWYVNIYNAGDQYAAEDFEDLMREPFVRK